MDFFQNCTALITGASSGIGLELARQLAPRATTLVLVARRLDRLETLKAELARGGLAIFCYAADLTVSEQIDALVKWLIEQNLQIDLLINNAGLGDYGPFETANWEKTERIICVNITALTKLTHALLPMLHRAPRASILNVSSIASFLPVPELAVYAASKAYVTSFSEALRVELHESSINVTLVCPGPTPTEFSEVAERSGRRMPSPDFFKVPVAQVASEALRAVARGRARVVPGWVVASLMAIAAALPMFVLRFLWRRFR